MPWNEVSTVSLRLEFVTLATAEGANVRDLCRRYAITPRTAYKWIDRFEAGGADALADRSRRPSTSPGLCPAEVEAAVLRLRDEHPAWGGRKLRARLIADGTAGVPAASTVTAILRRHGRLDHAHRPFVRFECEAPNQLWQMDFNALRSTGPRTEEGKDRSRRNAIDHGLASEVVFRPEDGAPPRPVPETAGTAGTAGTAFGAWLAAEVAVTTRRLDRCRRSEEKLREEAVLRARNHWDEDRRTEAEALGASLSADPAGVVDRLRRTPQGCDWLIERWLRLARAADVSSRWTEMQAAMAFDLLGLPEALRTHEPGEILDPIGLLAGRVDHPSAVARREVEALREHRPRVIESDAFARKLDLADHRDEPTPEVRRLRRCEATFHRRLR